MVKEWFRVPLSTLIWTVVVFGQDISMSGSGGGEDGALLIEESWLSASVEGP